ncbi:hypothetical protein ACIHCM_34810 [Streptomyces sp. NPDC052023]|uniref:hypothetical protein n=1 Tax=Streptomyces sp. NPDC052023 TaxID=3365681 RepID=UPI0037D39C91
MLASDVPLGPFEGTPITDWSGRGRQAKLHAAPSCSYLRSAQADERVVYLDAAVVGRMCPQCGTYNSWARLGTGLAVFLDTLTGPGLLHELDRFRDTDESSPDGEEIRHAAAVLYRPVSDEPADSCGRDEAEDDDGSWQVLQEARQIRESVFREWRGALASLHRTHRHLELFPWLRPWAEPAIEAKAERLRGLQGQAALLVDREVLLMAAAAAQAEEPDVPAEDPAFTPLGGPDQVRKHLVSLWQRWSSAVADTWDAPQRHTFLAHRLVEGMGSRRKGRDQILERGRAVMAGWEREIRSAVGDEHGERTLVARLPHDAAVRGVRRSLLDRLGEWELGVLALHTVSTVWEPNSVITVRVPEPVAARLLAQRSGLSYSEPESAGTTPSATGLHAADKAGLGPGVFDDTPVHRRRVVSAGHVRALRAAMRDAEQLYAVFSRAAGLEVVSLSTLEQRCAEGWQGTIIAGASDLPDALFTPSPSSGQDETRDGEVWPSRVHDPHHEDFGRHLSVAEGERVLQRLCARGRDTGHALRSLSLAQGLADLRQLDTAGYDDQGNPRRPFASAVWHGLLAMEQLDLEPFASDTGSGWQRGSGLPLGTLAGVQVYTSDAFGAYEGRAHSPGCTHRRPEDGLYHDDDLVPLERLIGNESFDPCSKCGGYAVRRLSEHQVAYYRAAHRLHDLAQTVSYAARRGDAERTELGAKLREFTDMDRQTLKAWFPSREESRQWRRTVDRLLAALRSPGPA